jgi:hypothetical protein
VLRGSAVEQFLMLILMLIHRSTLHTIHGLAMPTNQVRQTDLYIQALCALSLKQCRAAVAVVVRAIMQHLPLSDTLYVRIVSSSLYSY